jgi:hypothetical protein
MSLSAQLIADLAHGTAYSFSHIYQPVMIKELLKSGGKANIRDIAAPRDAERTLGPSGVVCRPFQRSLNVKPFAERRLRAQSLWMHLNARNVSFDQAAVIHCRRRFEVLADLMRHKIQIVPGDRVTVEMSPLYDSRRGRIVYRHRD